LGPVWLRGYSQKKKNNHLSQEYVLSAAIHPSKSTFFRHLNGINRHSFVSKTKSKTTFMKKIQSPQKLFQKHDDKMRYEIQKLFYFYA